MLPRNWPLRIIQLLAVPGLLLSYYLYLYHQGSLVAACGASGWDDCGKVSGPGAPYSEIGPVPVAALGMAGYALIFLVTWLDDWLPALHAVLPEIMVGLTGFALLLSLGLTGLELFVIHAICRYCVISAVIVLVMFVLALLHLKSRAGEDASIG